LAAEDVWVCGWSGDNSVVSLARCHFLTASTAACFNQTMSVRLEEPPFAAFSDEQRFAIVGLVALSLPYEDLAYPRGRYMRGCNSHKSNCSGGYSIPTQT